jgi:hypothetical protein
MGSGEGGGKRVAQLELVERDIARARRSLTAMLEISVSICVARQDFRGVPILGVTYP